MKRGLILITVIILLFAFQSVVADDDERDDKDEEDERDDDEHEEREERRRHRGDDRDDREDRRDRRRRQREPFFNDLINCAVEFEIAHPIPDPIPDIPDHGDGGVVVTVRQDATDRNLTGASQFARRRWGNNSCMPAAMASILEYWNRTQFPGILARRDIDTATRRLRSLSHTSNDGTTLWNFTIGVARYLRVVRLSQNFTYKAFVADRTQNDSVVIGNRSIGGLQVTYVIDNNITFADIVSEARTETVILIVDYPGVGRHAVALSSYNPVANTDGTHDIMVMDPRLGRVIVARVNDNFGTVIQFPNNVNAGLLHMISLSPRN